MHPPTNMSPNEAVSVIMPTRALPGRAGALRRALYSVTTQTGVRSVPIVVVNGSDFDADLVADLAGTPGLRVARLEDAHLGRALSAGHRMVDTMWFAELDDDDLLLPNALALRVQRLKESPKAGVVVTNGISRTQGCDRRAIDDMSRIAGDPVAALATGTWLYPGAALFRTDSVPTHLFDDIPPFLEWTCIAVRLLRTRAIEFSNEVTFVHHDGTPDSVWSSPECVLGLPGSVRALLDHELPQELRPAFKRRFAAACNAAAILEMGRGRLPSAWQWHLRCLSGGGWRYLPYTRHLLRPHSTAKAVRD